MSDDRVVRPTMDDRGEGYRARPRGLRRVLRGLPASALLGAVIVGCVAVAAVLAPVLAPDDPLAQDIVRRLSPPSLDVRGAGHLLGTDTLGRDILSRIIYGARVSLIVGTVSVFLAGTVGTILGLVAAYNRGVVDVIVSRIVDIQLAIPFMVLAIGIAAVLGPGLRNIILVLAITGWVRYTRQVRAEVLSLREREFVESARAVGCGSARVMFRHILPNVMGTVIVVAALEVARMIIAEASLSFLGLGVKPDTVTWGAMVADGRNYVAVAWWVATIPGLAILVTVLGLNLLGDWIRDRLDPTLRTG